MSKRKNELLQLVLLIILIVSIPLIFICLETVQKFKAVSAINPEDIVTNSLDELYKTILRSSKNDDSSTIRKCLSEIFDLMNNRQFDELYTLLTDDMKEHYFPTKEAFLEHMESSLGEEKYSPSFSKYEKLTSNEDDIFVITTDYLPYSTSKDDIKINKDPVTSDTFIIFLKSDSSYKFSFLGYIGNAESLGKTITENVSIRVASTHLYTTKTVLDIEIANNSPHTVYLEGNNVINVYTGFMPKFYSQSVFVPANTTTTISFTLYTGFTLKNSLPTKLYFNGVQINEKVYFLTLPINYPIKLY